MSAMISIDDLEKGCFYGVGTDGVFYKLYPRVKLPLAKKINVETGEVIYPTNADRIRDMSDEELADWLIMNGDGSDYKTWLEWLKQEVSDDS